MEKRRIKTALIQDVISDFYGTYSWDFRPSKHTIEEMITENIKEYLNLDNFNVNVEFHENSTDVKVYYKDNDQTIMALATISANKNK
jgi:hypothetical protein